MTCRMLNKQEALLRLPLPSYALWCSYNNRLMCVDGLDDPNNTSLWHLVPNRRINYYFTKKPIRLDINLKSA